MSTEIQLNTSATAAAPRLTMRGGAVVLRGVTRFIRGARSHRQAANQGSSSAKSNSVSRRRKKMSEKDLCKCPANILEGVKRDTSFSKNEIDALYKIYKKLITYNKSTSKALPKSTSLVVVNPATASEGIDRVVFREVLHSTFDIITENMLMDRIFCVWDTSNCGVVSLESWFHGMSLFLKGNVLKQTQYCFNVYDLNGDGFITKDEMFQLLRNCLIKLPQEEDPEESVKDLVDIVMRKMDKDKDGKVSLSDYQQTTTEEPLLLEAFGRCLPSDTSRMTFLTTLQS
ncbi:calaxin [Cylas formicarius]|uniref:calaxin n=1 Tax=Cylas formicarius TaxID=197179 RepID=UPI0029583345|nr:calaxin [Cylas formicarius]